MNRHQWNRFIVEIQVRLIVAMLVLMGLAGLLTLVVVVLRWMGVPC